MDAVRRLVEANLIAPFNLCREAARLMIENGEGKIVNVTSIAGPIAGAGDAAYTAAKGASKQNQKKSLVLSFSLLLQPYPTSLVRFWLLTVDTSLISNPSKPLFNVTVSGWC